MLLICMTDRAVYARNYYLLNKESINQKNKLYRQLNAERIAVKKRENDIKNADAIKVAKHNYYIKNRERILASIKANHRRLQFSPQ